MRVRAAVHQQKRAAEEIAIRVAQLGTPPSRKPHKQFVNIQFSQVKWILFSDGGAIWLNKGLYILWCVGLRLEARNKPPCFPHFLNVYIECIFHFSVPLLIFIQHDDAFTWVILYLLNNRQSSRILKSHLYTRQIPDFKQEKKVH